MKYRLNFQWREKSIPTIFNKGIANGHLNIDETDGLAWANYLYDALVSGAKISNLPAPELWADGINKMR